MLAGKWISIPQIDLMKTIMNSILEALFNPNPNDYLKRNHTDNYQYGHGLILIPVPNTSNPGEQREHDMHTGRQ